MLVWRVIKSVEIGSILTETKDTHEDFTPSTQIYVFQIQNFGFDGARIYSKAASSLPLGLSKPHETMVKMQPERIVYVSYNPSTLARDLNYLTENGYRVDKVQPVDMFPHTAHVECVVLMSRVEK